MTIAELVSESEITANPRLLELQERANEMAKYYCKGFGDAFNSILGNASRYVRMPNHEKREDWKKEAYSEFDNVNGFYRGIIQNFPNMLKREDKKEFYSLIVVSEWLPIFKEGMDRFFESGNDSAMRNLTSIRTVIIKFGEFYAGRLNQILDEIHSFPEGKNFNVKLKTIDGKVWETGVI